uniref:SHSP domain-containing protein n=1 Tax=Ananas comosus var. bracteatus TaxID=296719 RepID=A0A6V7NMD0_ANACO|nr:unnamed protein product [Ananas comosus var. bracteatus]
MGAMRVHPAPKKRNITIRYDANAILAAAAAAGVGGGGGRQKKLRRLPHIFSKVLELPFGADAEVSVEEDSDGFRFVAAADDLWDDVRALPVEIHPGVMKVVIRPAAAAAAADSGEVDDGSLELNRWRFRLPPYTRPSLATAAYVDGELIVTVPKGAASDEEEGAGVLSPGGRLNGGIGRLMLVQ